MTVAESPLEFMFLTLNIPMFLEVKRFSNRKSKKKTRIKNLENKERIKNKE